jgi:hypothetical protein
MRDYWNQSNFLMEKRKVTPEEVVELMQKEGEILTIEQAQKVLDFMYKMAEITLSILLDEKRPK